MSWILVISPMNMTGYQKNEGASFISLTQTIEVMMYLEN